MTTRPAIPDISPARIVAAQVLQEVMGSLSIQAADSLNRHAAQGELRQEDVRLARTIIFGVLRYGPMLDYFYAPYLKKTPSTLDSRLRLCLQMAVYQRNYLTRIPTYAIVNETVSLARNFFHLKQPQVGFLNAVLRQIFTRPLARKLPEGNRVGQLSVRYSMPDFTTRLLVERFGTHKAVEVMAAVLEESEMVIRVNTLRTTPEGLTTGLTRQGFTVSPGHLLTETLVVEMGEARCSLFETPEFFNGFFYVQDEASQLVARLVRSREGERILDLCAAPGGKTTHLAELAGGNASITATDISADRLNLVRENIQRLGTMGVDVVSYGDVAGSEDVYDAVLVDAPCSGAGTIRRNPEIKYRLSAAMLKRQVARQTEALSVAAARVRKGGGRLVYSTCSFTNEENRQVIGRFLQDNGEWSVQLTGEADELASLRHEDGYYRTWPAYPHLDGFEAVVLVRK